MKMLFCIWVWGGLFIWLGNGLMMAQDTTDPRKEITTLLRAGERESAFSRVLGLSSQGFWAARIGTSIPTAALRILDSTEVGKRHPERLLIRGDVLIALGNKAEALTCYRQYAAQISATSQYAVEPPASKFEENPYYNDPVGIANPFFWGPGSHRDNWLLRRFLAFQANADAAREFERMWALHQKLVGTHQYPPLSLQFVLDYAFFLSRNRQTEKALELVRTIVMQVNFDRNPGFQMVEDDRAWLFNSLRGLTRKEFVRLAYGFFKSNHREPELVAEVRKLLEAGHPSARRLYARLVQLQGAETDAFREELAYVEALTINEKSKTYRRGLVYESFDHMPEAFQEFTTCFHLPDDVPELADPDEGQGGDWDFGYSSWQKKSPKGFPQYDLVQRLQRLATSVGDFKTAFSLRLVLIELRPQLLWNHEEISKLAQAFKNANRADEFASWVQTYLVRGKDRSLQKNLAFFLQDLPAYLNFISEEGKQDRFAESTLPYEVEHLLENRPEWLVPCLERLGQEHPENPWIQTELLLAQGKLETPVAIPVFENLLKTNEIRGFSNRRRGKVAFDNQFVAAYRLMRLYEQNPDPAKMLDLALRIARQEAPFVITEQYRSGYAWASGWSYADATLTVAIQTLSETELKTLQASLTAPLWGPVRTQLQRRLQVNHGSGNRNDPAQQMLQPVSAQTGAIVSYENVLSLCRGEKRLYVGHPWGVAVRDFEGNLVRNIFLADTAQTLAVVNKALWVGTSLGVIRVDLHTFARQHLGCDQELSVTEKERAYRTYEVVGGVKKPKASEQDYRNGVVELAAQGDLLWIGSRQNIRTYDTRTGEMRIFLQEELGVDQAKSWSRFLFDGPYVWASSEEESIRYDSRSSRWEHPPLTYRKPALVSELRDGKLWGTVEVSEWKVRPCLIDRETMALTVFPIIGSPSEIERADNPLYRFGTRNGNLIFGESRPQYELDVKRGKLRIISTSSDEQPIAYEPDVPFQLQHGRHWTQPDGTLVVEGEVTNYFDRQNMQAQVWRMVELPNGVRFWGGQPEKYSGLNRDWPEPGREQDRPAFAGGLWRMDGAKAATPIRLSSGISGNVVFAMAPDETGETLWVMTDRGLAVLDKDGKVVNTFTRNEGLPVNRIIGGRWKNGVFEFETDADSLSRRGWFDPKTGVFQVREMHHDLPKVSFPWKEVPLEKREPMPLLGGFMLGQQKAFGKTWLFGTRGILVYETEPGSLPPATERTVTLSSRQPVVWRTEAESVSISEPVSLQQFAELMKSENPYVLVKAIKAAAEYLEAGNPQFITLAAPCLQHSNYEACNEAVKTFGMVQLPVVTRRLTLLVSSSDRRVRTLAAFALAQQGVIRDVRPLVEILANDSGLDVDEDDVFPALAPYADAKVFEMLLPYTSRFERGWEEHFLHLAQSLERHPEVLPMLLKFYPEATDSESASEAQVAYRSFLSKTIKPTRRRFLPELHQALTSPDRVIRAHAAWACGAIQETASIPHLVRALDLESGLSRAAIVWALGELKAKEALPALAKIYTDARTDEQRRSSSGYRFEQRAAGIQSEFNHLASFASIGRDWDELKENALPKPIVPQRNEILLKPDDIIETIGKIGPEYMQAFYRVLAGETDSESRMEAAEKLCLANQQELAQNRLVLRSLLADNWPEVRIRATVSLLILGETDVQSAILAWLVPSHEEVFQTVAQLGRVNNPQQLNFARATLEKLMNSPGVSDTLQREIQSLLEKK